MVETKEVNVVVDTQEIVIPVETEEIVIPIEAIGTQGEKGDKGDTALSVSVGSVTTGEAGTNASVTNSGTDIDLVLDFIIPKGAKGDKGDTGSQGSQGEKGTDGEGVPSGGTTGQVLAKKSNTDYDTEWINNSGGSGGTTNYNQLENKPKINNIELSGNKSLEDLGITNFSGSYDDLSNKPTIPTALSELTTDETHRVVTDEEKSAWNNKSSFSGSYDDLENKPTIPTNSDFSLKDLKEKSYNNLTDKPTIPTVPDKVSAFENDAGYLTEHQNIEGKEDKSNKITTLSSTSTDEEYPSAKCVYDEINNSGFITKGVTDVYGTSENPVNLNTLEGGLYNVYGPYKYGNTQVAQSSDNKKLMLVGNYGTLANSNYKQVLIFDAFQNITYKVIKSSDNSVSEYSLVNNNELYFQKGDTFECDYDVILSGYVTSGATSVRVAFPSPKRLDKINSITCQSFKCEARGLKGYLNSEAGSIEYVGRSGYTISINKSNNNVINFLISKSSAWTNVDNNTPVVFVAGAGGIKLTFN